MRRAARPLLFVGIAASVVGLSKVHAAYVAEQTYDYTGTFRFGWSIAYIGLLCVAAYGTGLPDLPRTPRQALTSSIVAPIVAAIGISLVQLVTGDALLPRFVVAGSVILIIPWSLFCVALAHGGRSRAEVRDRLVLVSDLADAVALRDELAGEPERPAVLLDHMTTEDVLPKQDGSRPLVELVTTRNATLVVLDRDALSDPAVVSQVVALHEYGVRVRTLSMFYEQWLGKLPISELERASLLFDIRELHGPRYLRVKRVLDLLVGVIGLVALALITPVVAVANRFGNRGPLIYRQDRVGKNSQTFRILKFRTMQPAADGDLPNEWTGEDDPRITSFGRLLRKTHVDELPQVVNIIRGDLSIVGPRPEQPHYVAELSAKLPFYSMRHLVRPGLTGWAQVKYGYAGSESDALEKLQYEFYYLRYQSLSFDARVMGRTIRSVLRRHGR